MIHFDEINEHTFTLNNRLLTKSDLILLLEMCGYDVPRNLPRGKFLEDAEYTLSTLIGDPVFDAVFATFPWDVEAEKVLWRQLAADYRKTSRSPSAN